MQEKKVCGTKFRPQALNVSQHGGAAQEDCLEAGRDTAMVMSAVVGSGSEGLALAPMAH